MTVKFSGTSLKYARLNARISQSELSRRTGINQSLISQMELGKLSNPSFKKLIPMAKALGVTVDDFQAKPVLVREGNPHRNVTFSPDRLKELRGERGLSQAEFAEVAKLTQACVSKYERGTHEPNSENLHRLANGLGVEISELMAPPVRKKSLNFSGENLREIRGNKKITLKKMSEDLDMKHPTISRYETGKIKNPSPAVLKRMSDYLGVSVNDFLSAEGDHKPSESAVPCGVKKGDQIQWKLSKPQVETIIESLKDLAPVMAASESKNQRVTIDLNFNINLLSGS